MTAFDLFTNRGEYLAAFYFAEQLPTDLAKGLLRTWTVREGDEHHPDPTPRQALRALRGGLPEDGLPQRPRRPGGGARRRRRGRRCAPARTTTPSGSSGSPNGTARCSTRSGSPPPRSS